jgi:cyclopropane fatty-acyl-phospholipid synthase-like methyltransferase
VYGVREYWLREGEKAIPPTEPGKTEAQVELLTPWISGEVYEVGCGWGRIATVLGALPNVTEYTGIDLSPRRVDLCKEVLATTPARQRAITDFVVADMLVVGPGLRSVDVVLSVEVLMHIPPGSIVYMVERLASFTRRYLINLDWHGAFERDAADHNFQHPYTEIYRGLPRLKELHVFPLPAFRQSLFVAELRE